MLGLQDIEVGDPEFDEAFIIKSNDEAFVRELLADPRIRQTIQALPRVRLEIKDNEGWFGTKFAGGSLLGGSRAGYKGRRHPVSIGRS